MNLDFEQFHFNFCFNFYFKWADEFSLFTSILLVYYFKRWDKFGLTNVHLHFCFIFHFKQLVKVGLQNFHFKFCFNLDFSKFHLNFCFNLYFELSVEFGLWIWTTYNLSMFSFTFAVHSAIMESNGIVLFLVQYYLCLLIQITAALCSTQIDGSFTLKKLSEKKLCETTLFTWLRFGLMQNCRPWLDPRLW